MKRVLPFLVVCMVVRLQAQAGQELSTGIDAYNQQQFEKALQHFDAALRQAQDLKENDLGKAYYYRALNKIALVQDARQTNNAVKKKKYENAYLDAYEDLLQAKAQSTDEYWSRQAAERLKSLHPRLLQIALEFLSQTYNDALSENQVTHLAQQALPYLNAAVTVNPNNYLNYDIRGQVRLLLKEDQRAMADFDRAQTEYQRYPPKKPDFQVAYVFYRYALHQRFKEDNPDLALNVIEEGINLLESEYERFLAMKPTLSGDIQRLLTEQYQNAIYDLEKFELDIYLNNPDKAKKALVKFEKAVAKQPSNYTVRVAYASLLEAIDTDQAIEQYQAAVRIDPGQMVAHFNLGVIYTNRGQQLFEKADDAADLNEKARLRESGENLLQQALNSFEDAYQIDREDAQIVNALIKISGVLNDEERYRRYKRVRNELEGYED